MSEGISEALINSLSELQQLRVIARPTAFRYKGKDVDPRQVGRELGVAAVLTGKVRQMQDALNVQVDLVDAVTGAQIWGAGYDRNIADLVAVKQAIAQEVTAKLKLKLSSEEQRRLVKRDSTNAEAYQFYLRGRYFWNKRTSDGIKQAIEHFQQSIERDPNFALGYVGLADSYTGLTFYNFAAPHETMPKAKESAIKALALDNTLAEAHTSLAHILIELRLELVGGGERVQAQYRTQARLCDGPSVVCDSLSNGYGSVGRSCPGNEKSAGTRAGVARNEHVYGSDPLLRGPVR